MILDSEVSSLYLRNRRTSNLHLVANEGFDPQVVSGLILSNSTGLVGLVASRTEPVNLSHAASHEAFEKIANLDESHLDAFLGLPLIDEGRTLGVLVVQRSEPTYTEDEVGFMLLLATQISSIIAFTLDSNQISLDEPNLVTTGTERTFDGLAGSPGIVIGKAVVFQSTVELDNIDRRTVEDVEAELALFEEALESVRAEIRRINEAMADHVGHEERALFDAYLHMIDDDAMAGEVREEIRINSQWAQGAVKQVFMRHVTNLDRAEIPYLSERGQDVRGLGVRVLERLQHIEDTKQVYADDVVVVAEEVNPTVFGQIPQEQIKGIVCIGGSVNSHSTILARAMNIPTVVGVTDLSLLGVEGATIVADGFYGEVVVNPSPETHNHYLSLIQREASFAAELEAITNEPSETRDGKRINLWVNIGLVSEITRSLDRGAEGIGLFRTEVPFAGADRFPTEEEQRQIYAEHMHAFEPRPVTMRTLDIGGDKDLAYFPIEEDNPYLGWRGIRVSLDHPQLFLTQIRAMLKANAGLKGLLRIMLPMISNLSEIRAARGLIAQAYAEIIDEGFDVKAPLVGAMIEVPALMYQADAVCREVDFLAVGTNDLTQYMLAVSRNNPRVAGLYQEFHPAIIAALHRLARHAHGARIGIGICGEMAGTVEGAVICVGMGYDVLSMNAANLPRVKWVLRNITMTSARRIVVRILKMEDAEEILTHIRSQLERLDLAKALPQHEHAELFM